MEMRESGQVIEFLGMPKAGKTTAIEVAESYLKQRGYKVRVVYEGARISPLDKSDRFMYNAWSFHNTVNRILEARLSYHDYILVDRGVYDHFAFLKATQDQCLKKDIQATYKYYDNFVELIDSPLLFMIDPEETIRREQKYNPFLGRVINQAFLEKLHQAYKNLIRQLGITEIDGSKPLEENTQTVLEIIKSQ